MENQVGSSQPTNESILGSDDVFTPMVEESKKPRLGMIFQSLVEAEEFYKEYGRLGGFDIRSSSTKYSQGILKLKLYVCSKEGISKRKSNEIRNCGTIRTGCKALLQLKTVNGNWMITKFYEDHNHGVTSPRRRHFIRGNRVVCDSKKKMVLNFKAANISTNKFMALLEKEGGGYDKIGCTEVDIRNYERDLREERRGYDVEMLLDYFMWQKEKNNSFHYEYEVDEEGRLTHCFWVDSIARLNYNIFRDVVTFDTTQNTNQYGLVFAPFVGVNNHWQTIFFGCGFLPNESANSFMWLFEKWLNVTGYPPKAMITDQDLGINTARSQIFPNTHHRYCIWHILDKLPDKLGALAFNKEFKDPFIDNIWNASDSTEFEDRWKKILTDSCLMNHFLTVFLASFFDDLFVHFTRVISRLLSEMAPLHKLGTYFCPIFISLEIYIGKKLSFVDVGCWKSCGCLVLLQVNGCGDALQNQVNGYSDELQNQMTFVALLMLVIAEISLLKKL